jgi:hypothetical protein
MKYFIFPTQRCASALLKSRLHHEDIGVLASLLRAGGCYICPVLNFKMSFTYGSFGDIITTVQLAARLLEALNDTQGSAHEFQDLVVELRLFHRALDQVGLACRLHSWLRC